MNCRLRENISFCHDLLKDHQVDSKRKRGREKGRERGEKKGREEKRREKRRKKEERKERRLEDVKEGGREREKEHTRMNEPTLRQNDVHREEERKTYYLLGIIVGLGQAKAERLEYHPGLTSWQVSKELNHLLPS